LVLPSFYEGQPLSMIEAATQGLAIVTTNVCGMKDFLTHEVDGLLLPVGDCAGARGVHAPAGG
jgi:glycosyltransferase involved in cell wall biosynthesis